MIAKFYIPCPPYGQARARRSASGGMFTPQKNKDYALRVKAAFYEAGISVDKKQFVSPLQVSIEAVFDPPKISATKLTQLRYVCKRPDADNIAKMVLDSLNGMAFHDDAQVHTLCVAKRWAHNANKSQGVYVEISYLI